MRWRKTQRLTGVLKLPLAINPHLTLGSHSSRLLWFGWVWLMAAFNTCTSPTERVLPNSVVSVHSFSLKYLIWALILKQTSTRDSLIKQMTFVFKLARVLEESPRGSFLSWWSYWQTGKGQDDRGAAPESRHRGKPAQGVQKLGMGSTVELTLRHKGWDYLTLSGLLPGGWRGSLEEHREWHSWVIMGASLEQKGGGGWRAVDWAQ